MFVLFRGPHWMEGSGGFGLNHSRLVVVAPPCFAGAVTAYFTMAVREE